MVLLDHAKEMLFPAIIASAPTPDKLTHDEFMAKLAANPQFKIVKPSGQGFIIGGQKPQN